jgi:AcrR family transcriptional regulator
MKPSVTPERRSRARTETAESAASPSAPAKKGVRGKQRVLEAACHLFAERGFHGARVRDVCRAAGVNVASVCYHFRDKRGLYNAVLSQARQTLSRSSMCHAAFAPGTGPEERLQTVIESLCERLNGTSTWIARLAARELVDDVGTTPLSVGSSFHDDLVLIQAILHEWLGSQSARDVIRLHALGLLGQCVFFSLVGKKLPDFLPQIRPACADQRTLAKHIVSFWLDALAHRSRWHGRGDNAFVMRPLGHQRLQTVG